MSSRAYLQHGRTHSHHEIQCLPSPTGPADDIGLQILAAKLTDPDHEEDGTHNVSARTLVIHPGVSRACRDLGGRPGGASLEGVSWECMPSPHSLEHVRGEWTHAPVGRLEAAGAEEQANHRR